MKEKYNKTLITYLSDNTKDVFVRVEQIYMEYEQRKFIKKRTIKELLK